MNKIRNTAIKILLILIAPIAFWTTKDQVIADLGPYLLPWPFKTEISAWPVFFVFWLIASGFWVMECCPRIIAIINEAEEQSRKGN